MAPPGGDDAVLRGLGVTARETTDFERQVIQRAAARVSPVRTNYICTNYCQTCASRKAR